MVYFSLFYEPFVTLGTLTLAFPLSKARQACGRGRECLLVRPLADAGKGWGTKKDIMKHVIFKNMF
ncbi:MAG: hypothetical protein EH225_09275 [Calditrichaeota bacterium]|nr:hypothetical protein [Calditrichota bacterium]RQW01758.1 MAG: hypothetical protein EH225_09275 [Calditrichota bacterium]